MIIKDLALIDQYLRIKIIKITYQINLKNLSDQINHLKKQIHFKHLSLVKVNNLKEKTLLDPINLLDLKNQIFLLVQMQKSILKINQLKLMIWKNLNKLYMKNNVKENIQMKNQYL